jgi:hypothetical protein
VTAENYAANLNAIYGAKPPFILAEYPLRHFSSAASALDSVMSDFRLDNGLNNEAAGRCALRATCAMLMEQERLGK